MIRKGIRKTLKWSISRVLKRRYAKYSSKDHIVEFLDLSLLVKAGVFHPELFFSTKVLIQFLKSKDLKGQNLLELGCGTGTISVWAARQGAIVTASDINPMAIENTIINSKKNKVKVECIESDLFENLDINAYSYVIINPPYYPIESKSIEECAWFCGLNFEYFLRLFRQLKRIDSSQKVLMVLSEDCDIVAIRDEAGKQGFELNCVFTKKQILEINYVFEINKLN